MLTYWLIRRLDPNWKLAHKLWGVRIAFTFFVFSGIWMALPSFQYMLDPFWFGSISVFVSIMMGLTQIFKRSEDVR